MLVSPFGKWSTPPSDGRGGKSVWPESLTGSKKVRGVGGHEFKTGLTPVITSTTVRTSMGKFTGGIWAKTIIKIQAVGL